jgi:hypothetical protein
LIEKVWIPLSLSLPPVALTTPALCTTSYHAGGNNVGPGRRGV